MPISAAEIDGFHHFAQQRLESGDCDSLEACLRAWREEQELRESIEDIRAGLADIEAGRVIELRALDREIRQKLGIPADA